MPKTRTTRLQSIIFSMMSMCAITTSLHAADGYNNAPVVPLIRNGSCPSRYSSSGNYCVPYSSARPAIEKNGSCPSGYSSSGNYCLAYSSDAKMIIPKHGSCPSGYSSSGNYCVNYR